MAKTLILCDCSGTQTLDADALSNATGLPCSKVHSGLCTTEAEAAAGAIATGEAIICCGQEMRFFEELAAELEVPAPPMLDLRDRAGWSSDTASELPKMSALIAEATLPAQPEKTVDIISEGVCLIVGGETALNAAEQLKDTLAVTVLLDADCDIPMTREFDVIRGSLRRAEGALGQFTVTIDQLRQLDPSGRGALHMTPPRDGGQSDCDIILDLSGGTALFPAPEKREGYLRADPGSLPAVSKAVFDAAQLVGTFEKPLYVKVESLLCAHSRAEQIGCSNCLDLCPTGAITPAGDHVSVDPMICAGCGACSAACPSGAISYDAPAIETMFQRVQVMAKAFRDAGGTAPHLLVVTPEGSEMIRLAARFGDGLPAAVLPMEVPALNAFGHAEIAAALAAGFAQVTLLPSRATDRAALGSEVALANAICGTETTILDEADPDAMSQALFAAEAATPCADPIRPMGTQRQVTRQAAKALHPGTDMLELPDHAPYGAVLVNSDACTLCLSCVSLCPSGALGDNPDMPQLRFQEDACLQCGLCANVCPEDAITYAPRLNLTDQALGQVVLHEEEPFACIECGALFGVKSTVEKITEKLAGKHSMFANENAAKMIQMCDNCRVKAQFHSQDNPFSGGDRPRVRTTDDYLSKRRDH